MKQKKLAITLLGAGLLLNPMNAFALNKSETVYVNLNYDGSAYKTVVSNHLSFLDENDTIDDTELKNILNINGNETFTQNDQKIVWKSTGSDIFYRGDTEKNLPIETEISYFLNEEKKDPEEMLGQEGKITIKIHFKNNAKKITRVNGKYETMYTPFVTMVGTMLDSTVNKNITITNGKVTSTGTRDILMGIASPGLYDSLKIDELKTLDEVTIEYTTTSFELNNIYLVSSPKMLEETDLDIFKNLNGVYGNIDTLQENMDILEKGIKDLATGADSLANGSKDLVNGLKSAVQGVESLKQGSISLDNGLQEVLNALNEASTKLNSAFDTQILTQLKMLSAQNTKAIQTLLASTNKTEEELATIYQNYDLANTTPTNENLLAVKNTYELITLLKANNEALTKMLTTIDSLSKQLNTLVNTLTTALQQLESGATELSQGLTDLQKGINKIYAGAKELNKGTNAVKTGANTLSIGAETFNSQGIHTLSNYANKMQNYSNKLEALVNLSKDYHGFTSNNADNSIFIAKVNSLTK